MTDLDTGGQVLPVQPFCASCVFFDQGCCTLGVLPDPTQIVSDCTHRVPRTTESDAGAPAEELTR